MHGILREASAILRRHATLYSGLALALAVLPDLFGDAAAEAAKAALPASRGGTLEGDAVDLLRFLIDVSAGILPVLGGLVLDVAVVLVALGPQARGARVVADGAGRLLCILLLAAAAFAAAVAWISWAPAFAFVPGSALISLWILALPVAAAEPVGFSGLLGRLRALARGRGGIARLVGAYVALYVVLGEVQLDLPSPFADASPGAWTVDAVEASLVAALAVFADATSVALYRAIRRVEAASSSSELAVAFD